MVGEELLNYFKQGLSQGFSQEKLKAKAREQGYSEGDINQALNLIGGNKFIQENNFPKKSTQLLNDSQIDNEKLGLFKKIGLAFSHPRILFEKTQDENVWSAFKYLLFILLVPFIICLVLLIVISLISSVLITSLIPFPGLVSGSILIFFVVIVVFLFLAFYIFTPVIYFIITGILHLVVKIFGGNGTYKETYKAIVYSATPSLLLCYIPIVNFVIGIWTLVLLIFALSDYHKISKLRAFFSWLLLAIVIIVIFILIIVGLSFSI